MQKQSGFSPIAVVLIIVIVAVVGFTGWYLLKSGKSTTSPTSSAPQPTQVNSDDETAIKQALLVEFCKGEYKKGWEASVQKTISDSSISASVDQLAINGNFARANNAGCDTTELTAEQKFSGFVAFFKKTDGKWHFHLNAQQAPSCDKFDGQGWPTELVPSCTEEVNGSPISRAPRP